MRAKPQHASQTAPQGSVPVRRPVELQAVPNPVLPGFHPDPSICRVGDTYYLATSTFQWHPGVRLHSSSDLRTWTPRPAPLREPRLLDLRGVPDSGGVWAPCLSHAPERPGGPGLFWLAFTVVRTCGSRQSDFLNALTTAPSIEGPWSDPVPLDAGGFDPSMFHDDDGRHWLIRMRWDPRPGREPFAGITIQAYDPGERALVGQPRVIFEGSRLGRTEGPHLYKRRGWYYLVTAEGGTSWDHAVTVARARELGGPYELDPRGPMLTSRDRPDHPIQKAGHASLVERPSGDWAVAYLGSRPLGRPPRCILGRETFLESVVWEGDWPRLSSGGQAPGESPIFVPGAPPDGRAPGRDDFDAPELGPEYQSLRVPADPSWVSLTERPGFCRLRGRDSLFSLLDQSLIARRVTAFRCSAAARVEFTPRSFQQSAGLIAYYDTRAWYYAHVSADDAGRRVLRLHKHQHGALLDVLGAEVPLAGSGAVELAADLDHERLRFRSREGEGGWTPLGPELDATVLSDDAGQSGDCFTGAFFGLCCQDLTGSRLHADFDWFDYTTG